LFVFIFEQQVQLPVKRLQLQIVCTLVAGKSAQRAAIPERDLDYRIACRNVRIRLAQRLFEFR
jgi:hypothetical protein